MSECIFAKLSMAKFHQKVLENDKFYAFHDIQPVKSSCINCT